MAKIGKRFYVINSKLRIQGTLWKYNITLWNLCLYTAQYPVYARVGFNVISIHFICHICWFYTCIHLYKSWLSIQHCLKMHYFPRPKREVRKPITVQYGLIKIINIVYNASISHLCVGIKMKLLHVFSKMQWKSLFS